MGMWKSWGFCDETLLADRNPFCDGAIASYRCPGDCKLQVPGSRRRVFAMGRSQTTDAQIRELDINSPSEICNTNTDTAAPPKQALFSPDSDSNSG